MKTGQVRGERKLVRFDGFTLDPAGHQLRLATDTLHLTPKAFDLLVLLVEEAPRVVSKRELHDRLWKDVFVADATLAGVVAEERSPPLSLPTAALLTPGGSRESHRPPARCDSRVASPDVLRG